MSKLRTVPIYRSGCRENLFMGGDREMVMFSGMLSAILIFCAQEWAAAFLGVAFWTVALTVFRKIAKSDPKQRFVYLRHRRYRDYYPARSTPFRINDAMQAWRYRQ